MRTWLRKSWPLLKALLTVAILVAVGWRFARDLRNPELWKRSLHPGWLVLSGVLYIGGLGFSALFWYRLLRALGQQPRGATAVRAYYLGQMGKYLPGKAWALLVRAALVRGPGVRGGVAALTSFYEVLTTMAGGTVVAAVLFAVLGPDSSAAVNGAIVRHLFSRETPETVAPGRAGLVLMALGLLAVIGIPILPPVFNRLAHRLSLPFRERDPRPLPQVRFRNLAEGLALTSVCWLFLGTSLWAVLQAVLGGALPFTWEAWGRDAAGMALAYVAGFVIIIVPSGLGIREFFLTLFLVPELRPLLGAAGEARAAAVLVVLLLRVVWTAAEVVTVAGVYWLPGPGLQAVEVTSP